MSNDEWTLVRFFLCMHIYMFDISYLYMYIYICIKLKEESGIWDMLRVRRVDVVEERGNVKKYKEFFSMKFPKQF